MKPIFVFLLTMLGITQLFSQGHIAPCTGSGNHTGGICYGYATGRAAEKSAGDATCDPLTLYQGDMNGDYFAWVPGTSLSGLQNNDIVKFTDHVAFVTGVSSPVGSSTASQYSTMRHKEETGLTLDFITREFGSWTGYYRRKATNLMVKNDFNGGDVKVDGGRVAGGSVQMEWWGSQRPIEALNQDYQSVWRQWSNWQKSGEQNPTTQNPRSITPVSADNYTANFTGYCDITGSNSLPGASGTTISIRDTVRNSGTTVRIGWNIQFTVAAINHQIDRVYYTFSSWSGDTTGSNSSFTITAWRHKSYTANFNSKPLPPENVWAGGTAGSYVQVTWTEHPSQYVTQYQIWRVAKDNGVLGSPTLVATLNRGTTSYTDYDFLITSGYTNDVVQYDVRSVFVVSGQPTQYSDPYYTGGVFATNDFKIVHSDNSRFELQAGLEQPKENIVSNFPNPFNPSTTISYQIVEDATVTLEIYDMMGRRISSLVQATKLAGYYTAKWEGRDNTGKQVATGVYLYRFSAVPTSGKQPFTKSGKLLLTK